MTKDEFKTKLEELIDESLLKDLKRACERLYDSGAINPDDYENTFALPKICLVVALENFARQYAPRHNQKYDKEIRNLRKF